MGNASKRSIRSVNPSVLVAMMAGSVAAAQPAWTVTNLQPAGAASSRADALGRNGLQLGSARVGNASHASRWHGTSASWEDLNPAGAASSQASFDTVNGEVYGSADFGTGSHAGGWGGPSSSSWFDLNPRGAVSSALTAEDVGFANFGAGDHAGRWGAAGSWADLNPAGAVRSHALGSNFVGQAVGYADFGSGSPHAGLWSRTNSWTDLHIGGWSSMALGVNGSFTRPRQVGWYVESSSLQKHACVWSGTAASGIDINPVGSLTSAALGIFGSWEDGNTTIFGYASDARGAPRAGYWTEVGARWVWTDMSIFLPDGFTSSAITDGFVLGNSQIFTGYGFNSITGREEALFWEIPSPGAGVVFVLGGMVTMRRRRH